ncbi:hypothetical protein MANI_000813 [Metarhizium anisopliae]
MAERCPKLQQIERLEHLSTPVDWEGLDDWIENADKAYRVLKTQCFECLEVLGANTSTLGASILDPHTMIEVIQASPAAQELRREGGPNWLFSLDELQRLDPDPNVKDCISLDEGKLRWSISMRVNTIMSDWMKLQDGKRRLLFREKWSSLTHLARKRWLLQRYPDLPMHPQSEIYAWARKSELETRNLDRRIFTSSFLNVEDLCHNDVLFKFLETRAAFHPRLFRTADSRSVTFGIWTGSLRPISARGFMLSFDLYADDPAQYGVSIKPTDITGVSYTSDPSDEAPVRGLYQLEAQQRTYAFLARCLSDFLDDPMIEMQKESSADTADGDQCLPLLTRALRLDYYGRPWTVDLTYLDNLINASFDEAQDDLWRLRKDTDTWIARLRETPTRPSGRVSNLVRMVFGRIDIFHTLSRHLAALKEHDVFRTQNPTLDVCQVPKEGEALGLLTSLHIALISLLEEQLCLFATIALPADELMSPVLSRLFNLLKQNHPTLLAIGLPAVMRTIDREIKHCRFRARISFPAMQILNDVSVLAGCLQETDKHHNLVSSYKRYYISANKLQDEWRRQRRPWMSLSKNALDDLGESGRHKLNVHVHDKRIDMRSRHRTFWNVIDKLMIKSSQGNATNEKVAFDIQKTVPMDQVLPMANHVPAHYIGADLGPAITATRMKRSKHRRSRPDEQSASFTTLLTKQVEPLPVVKPVKDKEFWKALLAPSSRNNTEMSWTDFCGAMQRIGYVQIRQGGSGRRFEFKKGETGCATGGVPGAIVFHEPHANRGKISHRNAQQWWLRRLKYRFVIEA